MTTHRLFSLRAAAVATAGLLTLGLAACSGDDPDDPGTTKPSASASGDSAKEDPSVDADPSGDASVDATDGGGGEANPEFAAFCGEAKALYEGEDISSVDPMEDPAGFVAALGTMSDKIAAVAAPEEIAADWQEFQGAVGQLAEGAKALDTSEPEAFNDALDQLASGIAPSEESQENIDVFISEHCG